MLEEKLMCLSPVAHGCWSTNLHPYLQVSLGLSKSNARHITSATTVVEVVAMLFVGSYIRRFGHVTPFIRYAVPCYIVGGIIMVCAPKGEPVVGIVLFAVGQSIMAVSRSSFQAVKEVAVLYYASADDSAVILAFLSLAERLGGMVGATVSDKMWTSVLPNGPKRYLSAEAVLSAERTHPLLKQHLSYAIGSRERSAIQQAYNDVQRNSLIASCVVMAIGIACVLVLHDINILVPPPRPHFAPLKGRRDLGPKVDLPTPPQTSIQPGLFKLRKLAASMQKSYIANYESVLQLRDEIANSTTPTPQYVADAFSSEMSQFQIDIRSLVITLELLQFLASTRELNEYLPHIPDAETPAPAESRHFCVIQ